VEEKLAEEEEEEPVEWEESGGFVGDASANFFSSSVSESDPPSFLGPPRYNFVVNNKIKQTKKDNTQRTRVHLRLVLRHLSSVNRPSGMHHCLIPRIIVI